MKEIKSLNLISILRNILQKCGIYTVLQDIILEFIAFKGKCLQTLDINLQNIMELTHCNMNGNMNENIVGSNCKI